MTMDKPEAPKRPNLAAMEDGEFINAAIELVRGEDLRPHDLALILGMALGRLHNATKTARAIP